jgi:hypothetical protein
MLGGSVLCGYVLGTLLEGRRPQAAPPRPVAPAADRNNGNGRHASEKPASTPTGESWLGAFEPEIQHLKGLALGVALGTVREMVSEQVPPHMAGQLREIIDAVTKKAGGAPIPSSDWHAAQPAPSPDAGPECSEVHAQNPRW